MIFWIALAGCFGAIARFMIDGYLKTKFSPRIPWATFLINVTGSFLLGIVTALMIKSPGFYQAGVVLGSGFMGGYTTFSTASFETVRLIEQRRYGSSLVYALGGVVATIVVAYIGYLIVIT